MLTMTFLRTLRQTAGCPPSIDPSLDPSQTDLHSPAWARLLGVSNNHLPTLGVTRINHPPTLPETLRRVQRILHKLHIRHLSLTLINSRPDTERRVRDQSGRSGAVFEAAENTKVRPDLTFWAVESGVEVIGRPGIAEDGVGVELENFPVGVDVDEGFPDCFRAGFGVSATPGFDLASSQYP